MNKSEVLKIVNEENIDFIRLQFTDIFGMIKSVTITQDQLENTLNDGCMFDGSSIEGFARVEESDMKLVPDLSTFQILPFQEEPGRVARIICDVYKNDKSFEGDPRYILKKAIKDAYDLGIEINIGPECEFFLFQQDKDGYPDLDTKDSCGYFDIAPVDKGSICRRSISLALKQMGFIIETSHHENAPSQHEIDFKYTDALDAADKIMTFRLTTKAIAREQNLYATFMPKPIFGSAGSGMHINMSLNRNGKNITYGDKEGGLSEEALYFVGGLLKHARGFAAITNPIVNSYKRLVSGFEAPTNIAWSIKNRSPLIRIPVAKKESTRIELRNPDPSCNPYLAFAAIIESGLDGIKNKINPPKIVNSNIFNYSQDELKMKGIMQLPENLHEAIEELKKDEIILNALGVIVSDIFIDSKEKEWDTYKTVVTSWEYDEYLLKY